MLVRAASSGLGCLLLAVAALPQDGPAVRRATFVRVVDRDGGPVAGAVVTLAGGLPHLGGELAPADTQQVAADARGRASAKLLPGLCYVAWAVGPAAAGQQCWMSPVAGWFGAGAVVELRCHTPVAPRALQCRGAEAWQSSGPLQFVALTPYPGAEVDLVPEPDGTLLLPPGPFTVIEVRTREGAPLFAGPGVTETLAIPPPRQLEVRTVDESGAPLAGVLIRHRVVRQKTWEFDGFGGITAGRLRDLGNTGADGRATVTVPHATDPLQAGSQGELLLFACAPGRPMVAGGWTGGRFYEDDSHAAASGRPWLQFTCASAEPLRGNCGPVPAGTVAHLVAVCVLMADRGGFTHDPRIFLAMVAADGSFSFPEVPAILHSSRLTLVPPPGSTRTFPLFPALAERQLPAEVAPGAPGRGDVLHDAADLRLLVVEPDGGPARGGMVYLARVDMQEVLVRDSVVCLPVDPAGRCGTRAVPGRWALLAVSPAGYGAASLDLTPGLREARIALEPLQRMRVLLRGHDGKPVAGAALQSRGHSRRGAADPVETMLQRFGNAVHKRWGGLCTDAEGIVSIPFVPANGVTYRLGLTWPEGTTEEFVLEATGQPLELRPR